MLNITIKTIPHQNQAYETIGNYGTIKEKWWIEISNLSNWKYEFLIAVHELIEQGLCKAQNISETEITNFDIRFEKLRSKGDESEPGDNPRAPYYEQHQFATMVETLLALELGVDWKKYEQKIYKLYGEDENRKENVQSKKV